jgi:NAD/NADP transhydrogenase alpha subunit
MSEAIGSDAVVAACTQAPRAMPKIKGAAGQSRATKQTLWRLGLDVFLN